MHKFAFVFMSPPIVSLMPLKDTTTLYARQLRT